MGPSVFKQRLAVCSIHIIDPERETRIGLAFAFLYVAAAAITGLVERTWRLPLWGATYLTSDATYVFVFKIGLLLLVPALAIRSAGYTFDDLWLGWRLTPRSGATVALCFTLGLLLNASNLGPIQREIARLPAAEATYRVFVGWILMLFCAGIPEELVYRWGLQTRLERSWGRVPAIAVTAVLFTAWHLPSRYLLASGAEGTAGDLRSVLAGTGLPVLIVALVFGVAWDRWRNLPVLIALHWGVDTLPSVSSFLRIPMLGGH